MLIKNNPRFVIRAYITEISLAGTNFHAQIGFMTVTKFKNIKPLPPRLPATQFWGLCFIVWMVLQVPMARIPILFLSTWAHELGHGLGAVFTGGKFIELTVFPNFSGIAQTATINDFQRGMVIVLGLLGPSLLGVLMIVLTRALNWYRVAIIVLAALLLLSQIWAADSFTRLALGGGTAILGLIAWKVPNQGVLYIAHITAIALCLNALTGFGYFFIGNAEVAGSLYRSDTGVMADILFGPHWLWGGLIAALSVVILFAGVILSDKWARRKDGLSSYSGFG